MNLTEMGKKSAQYLRHQCHSNEGLINIDPTRSLEILRSLGKQTKERAKLADMRENAGTVVMKNLPKGNQARVKMAQDLRKQRKLAKAEASGDNFSTEDRIRGALMGDDGKYSGVRIGIAGSALYMGANMIGHGSLGIPFISTASWNR